MFSFPGPPLTEDGRTADQRHDGPMEVGRLQRQVQRFHLELVSRKVEAGETETVTPLEEAPSESGATNVIDLIDLFAKSRAKRQAGRGADSGASVTPHSVKKAASKSFVRMKA